MSIDNGEFQAAFKEGEQRAWESFLRSMPPDVRDALLNITQVPLRRLFQVGFSHGANYGSDVARKAALGAIRDFGK